MSKSGLESEIGISKSSFWFDGLYKDTFPLMFLKSKSFGKAIENLKNQTSSSFSVFEQ